jgi:hypothetical protein
MKNKIKFPLLIGAIGLMILAGFNATQALSGMAEVWKMSLGSRYKDIYKEEGRSHLIKFSHTYHLSEVGAECVQCHVGIDKSESSSDNNLTKMDACYTCHDQKTTECSKCHVEKGEPYSAFANPKRELIYSHKKHVADLKMKCETCHTGIATKVSATAGSVPPMESCMDCHDGKLANNNCTTCHTDVRFIRPADHMAGFVRTHKQVVASRGSTNCVFCHTEESCQDCHQGGSLSQVKGFREFVTSKSPKTTVSDQSMNLETAHALDYLFTHRFDAKAKTMDCQSCHETESFCSKCHDQGAKVFKPAWHGTAGFVTPKGSGGGMHAMLAKKDMENCASCHQVEGKDPVCLNCHNSNGSVR